MRLSLVIPVYNEEQVLAEFFRRLAAVCEVLQTEFGITGEEVEILLVNDGSTDTSFHLMRAICRENSCYRLINLSRNHGHQLAITAGIDHSRGEAVIVMDADLQDPPEIIPRLYARYLEGYDVVHAVRSKREGEGFLKRVTAALFYRLLKRLTQVDISVDTGDFRLLSRRVAQILTCMRERHRFVRGMVSWVGFQQTQIAYVRDQRFAGETKYPWRKMVKFALDGITSFSTVPLKLSSYLGFATAFAGFLYSLDILYVKWFTERAVPGWTSIIITVLFLGGVQLIVLGVIGEYLSRISDESKNRPLYLVEGIYRLNGKDETGSSGGSRDNLV